MLARRKKLVLAAIVLIFVLLEVYAHSYVPVNALSVVPEDQTETTRHGAITGEYTFIQSNCHWIAKWVIDSTGTSSGDNHAWVWIYKTEEEQSFLSSETGILVSDVTKETKTSGFEVFFNPKQNLIYEDHRADIRIDLHFGENGTYQVNLSLNVKFYQRTLIGILPTGEQKIPINATLSAFLEY